MALPPLNPMIDEAGAPRFSLVVPHFDGAISDDLLLRGLDSLKAQTFTDFEVLLYHDGPLSRPLPDLSAYAGMKIRVGIAPQRHNDWGHSLRNHGVHSARGDYIVHFNPDNVLYPDALATLDAEARRPVEPNPLPERRENPDILVFAVLLYGERFNGTHRWRDRENPAANALLMSGVPPRRGFIDAMQVVVRRRVWLEIGGWYDRREDSDGYIYEALIATRGARYIPRTLGEHW